MSVKSPRNFSSSGSDKMIEEDKIVKEAKKATEEMNLLDEIDKVSASDRVGGDVSRRSKETCCH